MNYVAIRSDGSDIAKEVSMRHRRAAGYTLVEILIVVAIIGVLSLIAVPAFMNFQRSLAFKSAMRLFSTDLRAARATAIQQSFDVRVHLNTGAEGPTTKVYQFFSSRDGTTWTPLNIRKSSVKTMEGPVWLASATNFRTIGGAPNIVFHPSGAADITNGATSGVVVLATNWQNMFANRYNITVTPAGQIRVTTP